MMSIWVKLTGAGAESVTFVDCDPSTTNIARLKKLVKAEYSRKLEHIDAPDLAIKDADGVTSVRCDPSLTTIDDLKALVKAKYSSKLNHIDAPELAIRGADGATIEEDALLSDRAEGHNKATAFLVELPLAAGACMYLHLLLN